MGAADLITEMETAKNMDDMQAVWDAKCSGKGDDGSDSGEEALTGILSTVEDKDAEEETAQEGDVEIDVAGILTDAELVDLDICAADNKDELLEVIMKALRQQKKEDKRAEKEAEMDAKKEKKRGGHKPKRGRKSSGGRKGRKGRRRGGK